MPTTTNNGWTIPADTDLVKNGALAIRTLGNAIDTTIGVYGSPGLVKITSTSFSAVSSQAINSCFSSTYKNYKVVIDITGNSTNADIYLKLRASSTDSSAEYTQAVTVVSAAGSTTNLSQSTATTGFRVNGVYSSISTYHSQTSQIDLFRPYETIWTTHNAIISYRSTGDGTYYGGAGTGIHSSASSYDGLNLIASAGTITGVVTVYAYKD